MGAKSAVYEFDGRIGVLRDAREAFPVYSNRKVEIIVVMVPTGPHSDLQRYSCYSRFQSSIYSSWIVGLAGPIVMPAQGFDPRRILNLERRCTDWTSYRPSSICIVPHRILLIRCDH